jgi:hypothetical protein
MPCIRLMAAVAPFHLPSHTSYKLNDRFERYYTGFESCSWRNQ